MIVEIDTSVVGWVSGLYTCSALLREAQWQNTYHHAVDQGALIAARIIIVTEWSVAIYRLGRNCWPRKLSKITVDCSM